MKHSNISTPNSPNSSTLSLKKPTAKSHSPNSSTLSLKKQPTTPKQVDKRSKMKTSK
jgi:hypothetical protein